MSFDFTLTELPRRRPEIYFIGSAIFHYLGPSFAVLLFAVADPFGVAWLRIVTAAAVFAVWRRPWRAWQTAGRRERTTVLAWGVLLALMNTSFYLAIDLLPLGTVAAIEFLGPIAIAAFAVRGLRNFAALALAVLGVGLLSEVRFAGAPLGFAFAFINMALFAGYIAFAHQVSRHHHLNGIDGLAAAMVIAGIAGLPLGIAEALPVFADPVTLGAAIGVGITSSVIPYVFDQLAMRRIPRATYALMTALLPATATVIGIIVLWQLPTALDIAGVSLVISAIAIHKSPGR
jgi:inner membrane transporter RhtA